MELHSRRVLSAAVLGIVSSVLVFILGIVLSFYAWEWIPEPGPGEDGIHGWNTDFRGSFPLFVSAAFSISIGLSVAAFVIDPKLSSRTEALICLVTFVAMLGVSSINFAVDDALLSRGKQALIDVLVVLFGAASLLNIGRWKPRRSISIAAKSLTIFAVGAFGVLVPLTYFSLYVLDAMGLPIPADEKDDSWIKILSALISGVAGFLAFMNSSKHSKG